MQIGVLSIFQNYRDAHDDGDVMRVPKGSEPSVPERYYDSYRATEHHFRLLDVSRQPAVADRRCDADLLIKVGTAR
jgi:hypothetical protein